MKKIFILILLIILNFFNCANAIEEIKLEKQNINLDYLSDVYYGKIEKEDEVPALLRLFSEQGLKFKNSKINSFRISMLYDSSLTYTNPDSGSSSLTHKFPSIEPRFIMRFNENKTEATVYFHLTRDIPDHKNGFTEKLSRAYISHTINKNQRILFGEGHAIPTNYNGSRSTMQREFVLKSQFGRTIGDVYAIGIRNYGTYKYLDYDIGIYDGARFMEDIGCGTDFTGFFMFKPFEDIKEKVGSFKVGTGHNFGKYKTSYHQHSIYTSYDYKKLHLKAEYAMADGYNNAINSKNNVDGFYTSISYDILPKFTLSARYDYFNANKHIIDSDSREYTLGLTYKPYKNMKLLLNFIRRNIKNGSDSNMILFATRIFI